MTTEQFSIQPKLDELDTILSHMYSSHTSYLEGKQIYDNAAILKRSMAMVRPISIYIQVKLGRDITSISVELNKPINLINDLYKKGEQYVARMRKGKLFDYSFKDTTIFNLVPEIRAVNKLLIRAVGNLTVLSNGNIIAEKDALYRKICEFRVVNNYLFCVKYVPGDQYYLPLNSTAIRKAKSYITEHNKLRK